MCRRTKSALAGWGRAVCPPVTGYHPSDFRTTCSTVNCYSAPNPSKYPGHLKPTRGSLYFHYPKFLWKYTTASLQSLILRTQIVATCKYAVSRAEPLQQLKEEQSPQTSWILFPDPRLSYGHCLLPPVCSQQHT